MGEKTFDPSRPSVPIAGGEGVENIDFSRSQESAPIINKLNSLWSDLRGAAPEDYDMIFSQINPKMLPEYRTRLQEIISNLDRIIAKKTQST